MRPGVHDRENACCDHPAFAVSRVAKPVLRQEDGCFAEMGDQQRRKGQDGRHGDLTPNAGEVLPRNTVEGLEVLEIARHKMER